RKLVEKYETKLISKITEHFNLGESTSTQIQHLLKIRIHNLSRKIKETNLAFTPGKGKRKSQTQKESGLLNKTLKL
ncbi:MAG: hypothetical protein Q4G11_07380, partial [Gallicola sp.]|nr:hypothetical protein [Gallicola sp.]